MMKTPVHPGEILREDVLAELGLSVSEAASRLGISRGAQQGVARPCSDQPEPRCSPGRPASARHVPGLDADRARPGR